MIKPIIISIDGFLRSLHLENHSMKKIITLLLLSFLIHAAMAQVEIRPFLGANFSNVSKTPDGASTQAKIGGQIGASLMIGNRFHLNPGISYFSRTTEYVYADSPELNTDLITNGISIPILVGYRFVDPTTEPVFNFRLYAGPSMMFLTQNEFSGGEEREEIDWSNTLWGGQLGAGLDIFIFFVDVSYEFGLSDTFDGGENNTVSDFTKVKNNTFYVNAGVRLSFSR